MSYPVLGHHIHGALAQADVLGIFGREGLGHATLEASDGALTLVIVNKTGGALTSDAALAGYAPVVAAHVYVYSASNLNAIEHPADSSICASGFTATFPASSIPSS